MKTRLFFAKESASAGNCSFRVAEKTRATPVIISIETVPHSSVTNGNTWLPDVT